MPLDPAEACRASVAEYAEVPAAPKGGRVLAEAWDQASERVAHVCLALPLPRAGLELARFALDQVNRLAGPEWQVDASAARALAEARFETVERRLRYATGDESTAAEADLEVARLWLARRAWRITPAPVTLDDVRAANAEAVARLDPKAPFADLCLDFPTRVDLPVWHSRRGVARALVVDERVTEEWRCDAASDACTQAVAELRSALAAGVGPTPREASLLRAQVACRTTSFGELLLDAAALAETAAAPIRGDPLEVEAQTIVATEHRAEARREFLLARRFAERVAPEHLAAIDTALAALPDERLSGGGPLLTPTPPVTALCLGADGVAEAQILAMAAEPLTRHGSAAGRAELLRRDAALRARIRGDARCVAQDPCIDALAVQATVPLTADPTAPRASFDAALVAAIRRKEQLHAETLRACAGDSPVVRVLRASAAEEMSAALGSSTRPPYLTPEQLELYEMALTDKAWPYVQRASEEWEAALAADPAVGVGRAPWGPPADRAVVAQGDPILAAAEAEVAYSGRLVPLWAGAPKAEQRVRARYAELDREMAARPCLAGEVRTHAEQAIFQMVVVLRNHDESFYPDLDGLLADAVEQVRAVTCPAPQDP